MGPETQLHLPKKTEEETEQGNRPRSSTNQYEAKGGQGHIFPWRARNRARRAPNDRPVLLESALCQSLT